MTNEVRDIDERRGCTSASNAEADALCPGRHLAQRGIPDSKGEYAEHGLTVHEALASRDTTGLDLEQLETYDRCLAIEGKKLAEFFGADVARAKRYSEDPRDPQKSRLWVKFHTAGGATLEHSCRPDCFWRVGDRVLLLEFKSLYGDVAMSNRNLQLRDQEIMVRGHYLIVGDIGVVVAQPLVTMNPPICVYSPEDSERARIEMFARVEMSNDPRAVRVPGDVQCKFCKAKTRCGEYQKFAGAMAPGMLSLLDVPVTAWTPEQRAIFMDRRKVASEWLDACECECRRLFKDDPAAVPGWVIGLSAKVETIANVQACWERFAALGGSLDAFMGAVKVGKMKLKEAINKSTGRKGRELESTLAALCEGICEVSDRSGSWKRLGPGEGGK
jgi:hypothetical protein